MNDIYVNEEPGLCAERAASYQRYIKQLWQLSDQLENRLEDVTHPTGPQNDKSEPSIKLHAQLERLVDRYQDIMERIEV